MVPMGNENNDIFINSYYDIVDLAISKDIIIENKM